MHFILRMHWENTDLIPYKSYPQVIPSCGFCIDGEGYILVTLSSKYLQFFFTQYNSHSFRKYHHYASGNTSTSKQ